MDVNLPDMSGTVATSQILTHDSAIVVLLVSTYEEADYAPQAAECGAAGYIAKPQGACCWMPAPVRKRAFSGWSRVWW